MCRGNGAPFPRECLRASRPGDEGEALAFRILEVQNWAITLSVEYDARDIVLSQPILPPSKGFAILS